MSTDWDDRTCNDTHIKWHLNMALSLVAIGGLALATAQSCPDISPVSFQLVDYFLQWSTTHGDCVLERGLQFIDINGDSLPDQLYGTQDLVDPPRPTYRCIYLNTGCAWVPQANYTGPDNSCLHPMALDIRGVRWSFRGLSVQEFSTEVAEFYGLADADVAITIGGVQGLKQSPRMLMADLAMAPEGFHVVLENTEVHVFVRRPEVKEG